MERLFEYMHELDKFVMVYFLTLKTNRKLVHEWGAQICNYMMNEHMIINLHLIKDS